MLSAVGQVVAAEVAAVADQKVLRKDADPVGLVDLVGTGDPVDLVDLVGTMDHRPTSLVAAQVDPVGTGAQAGQVGPISTVADRVTSMVAAQVDLTSMVVDPVTSTVVDPAITTGVRRGIPVTTTGMGAGTERPGATDPRRGAGVHRRLRRGSDRCHPRGDRPRRRSTIGASRSSQSGIRATTSGASTSSGSGFHFHSDPDSWQ